MTKLSTLIGDSSAIRTRTFQIGGVDFRVKVPLSSEIDAMNDRINKVDQAEIAARFEKSKKDLTESDTVKFTEDDVLIEDRSLRDITDTAIRAERRILEFVRLIVPQGGGTMDDLTYDDIEAEWPFAIQLEILNKIVEAIQPGFESQRKN